MRMLISIKNNKTLPSSSVFAVLCQLYLPPGSRLKSSPRIRILYADARGFPTEYYTIRRQPRHEKTV